MSVITQRDRNRLATLIERIRPKHSFAAKLEALSPDDRAHYDRWKQLYDDWFERCKAQHDDDIEPLARPYARTLERDTSPQLPTRISNTLYPMITISKNASDEQAAQIWFDEVMR